MRRPIIALFMMAAVSCFGQNSDFRLSVHAISHATAKDIGLPAYPGATPFKDKDKDSDSSADLGFALNSFQFNLQVATFVTRDSWLQVLEFYRKPLAKYGEVLECNHGKPVGSLTTTKTGLTCGDQAAGNGYELRAGRPEQFRIVGIDNPEAGQTKFGLVALVLPKEQDGK